MTKKRRAKPSQIVREAIIITVVPNVRTTFTARNGFKMVSERVPWDLTHEEKNLRVFEGSDWLCLPWTEKANDDEVVARVSVGNKLYIMHVSAQRATVKEVFAALKKVIRYDFLHIICNSRVIDQRGSMRDLVAKAYANHGVQRCIHSINNPLIFGLL